MYADRIEAGQQLARLLTRYQDPRLLILGLPRGGVVVAAEIARPLQAELNMMMCMKLRAPGNPELALGAVSEGGTIFWNVDVYDHLDVGKEYLEQEKRLRLDEMAKQIQLYRAVCPKPCLMGRTVMVVDDGLATGATMIACIRSAASERARSIVVAVPGGPGDTVETIRRMSEVDDIVCPEIPSMFSGVGQLYRHFEPVEDAEVMRILSGAS